MTTRCSVGNEMPHHNDERCGQRDAARVTRYSTGNEMGLDDKTQCMQQDVAPAWTGSHTFNFVAGTISQLCPFISLCSIVLL